MKAYVLNQAVTNAFDELAPAGKRLAILESIVLEWCAREKHKEYPVGEDHAADQKADSAAMEAAVLLVPRVDT